MIGWACPAGRERASEGEEGGRERESSEKAEREPREGIERERERERERTALCYNACWVADDSQGGRKLNLR